jgi:hypothetical protein
VAAAGEAAGVRRSRGAGDVVRTQHHLHSLGFRDFGNTMCVHSFGARHCGCRVNIGLFW